MQRENGNGKALAKASPIVEALSLKRKTIETLARDAGGVERLMKQAEVCIFKNPDIGRCNPATLVLAVSQAAELGLDLTSGLGTCYLVPYNGVCQLIIGYRGLIELARRSGNISTIEARVVRQGDEFDYQQGTEQFIRHRPGENENAAITHVYAIAVLADGGKQFEVMTKRQVDRIAKNSPVWKQHYDEMARKTVVRRLCKYLPLSPDLMKAAEFEDEYEVVEAEHAEQRETARVKELDDVVPPIEDEQGGGDDGDLLPVTFDG